MAVTLSLLACVVTFAFAAAVFVQYVRRPRLFRLVWSVALVCYGVATAVQSAAASGGWTIMEFRAWYLSGGLLTAAYLGQGTAHLVLPRRVATLFLVVLLAATAWGTYRTLSATIALRDVVPSAGKVTPSATKLAGDLRALAAVLNIYGTLLLVGGALWSALLFFDRILDTRRRAGHRLFSNLLIALGAIVVASAGSLETLGHGEFLYGAEMAGIVIIFLGFLRSRESMGLPQIHLPLHHVSPASDDDDPAQPAQAQPDRSLRRISDRLTTPRR